jgi:hypothetical protein
MPTRNILSYGTHPPPKIDYEGQWFLRAIKHEAKRLEKKYNHKPKYILMDQTTYHHIRMYLLSINLEHETHRFYPDQLWDMKIVIYPIKDRTILKLVRTPVQEVCYPNDNTKEYI